MDWVALGCTEVCMAILGNILSRRRRTLPTVYIMEYHTWRPNSLCGEGVNTKTVWEDRKNRRKKFS
jgi:hypothetical protein